MSNKHRQAHEKVITDLISSGFLSPRPKMMGVRAWSMLLPSIAQVVGLCCFGVVAWSFTEFSGLPTAYRVNLVVFGAFAIALGGGVGSLPVTLECTRKKLSSWWDWTTLIFSGIASFVETVMALSLLGGFDIAQSMPRIILLAALATLDTCLGMGQLGAFMASHDEQMTEWKKDYKRAVKWYYSLPAPETEPVTYEVPTGEHAYTPKMPEPTTISENSNDGHCWCGFHCKNFHAYNAHVGHNHHYETLYSQDGDRYTTGAQARDAMLARYAGTVDGARWEFPTLDKVREMRRKAARKWPKAETRRKNR